MKRPGLAVSGAAVLLIVGGVTTWTTWEYFFQSKNYRAYNSFPHPKRIFSKDFSSCIQTVTLPSGQYPFSGGGRVNFAQMDRLNKSHPGNVMVVNLREDDGYYRGDHPISYYGMYFQNNELQINNTSKQNKQWLFSLRRWLEGLPSHIEELRKEKYNTEQEGLENIGVHYTNFELERKDFAVNWGFVDQAVDIFEKIPENTWVHFHCAGGRGRTTSMAMLYDIFRNGKTTPLSDVFRHHYCLGGEDILDTEVRPFGTWSKENLEGRKALIVTFHEYINAPDGYPHKKWTQWLQDNGYPVHFTLGSKAQQNNLI